MQATTDATAMPPFVEAMAAQMAEVTHCLSQWVRAEPRTLASIEQQTVQALHQFGTVLLTGLVHLTAPAEPPRQVACACGQPAPFHQPRPAQVLTVLGPVTITRPYYWCRACHHGFAPLDQQVGCCAGSISAGLAELLALLGAQADSFEAAAAVLEKLTLVRVGPTLVREATETLGQVVSQVEAAAVAAAWAGDLPPAPPLAPGRLYVALDGVLVPTRDDDRSEVKLGTVYTTKTVCSARRPEHLEVRAQDLTYVADLADATTFGRLLWWEAARRGVLQAPEVIVLGDGAPWIWNLAREHFPSATQIVDWYHASQYVWQAAHAIYGEGTDLARQWAQARLDDLWEGRVGAVVAACHPHSGKAVEDAISYFLNNQARMRYAEYRARGLQLGSGSIESGCKHVIGARLKQAGMRWSRAGARAVAKVRAWLKSGRWEEAVAHWPPPQRSYHRRAA